MQTLLHTHNCSEIPEIFSENQINQILITIQNHRYREDGFGDWIKKRNIAMFMTSYHLATRPKEVCMLKISDIDFKNKLIHIPADGNKIHKGRIIAIPSQLIPFIADYLKTYSYRYWKASKYLFPSMERGHISRDRWGEIFRDILKESGIYKAPTRGKHGHYTPYTLRHTKLTQTYLKTKDPHAVANIAGHKSLDCVNTYVHLASMSLNYLNYMRWALS